MTNYETEGVVIGSKNFGDTDKIVTLFTLERGKVKAVAYGARRNKSPFAASLQMFNHLELSLSEGKNLDVVRSANLKSRYPKIESDLTRMAYAMFIAEILSELFSENTREVEVFEFILDVLKIFEERNPRITAELAVWKLLSLAGFLLSLDMCPICNKKIDNSLVLSVKEGGFLCENCHTKDELSISLDAKNLLLNFIKFDWKEINSGLNFLVQGDKLTEVEKVLIKFLNNILGFTPKSLKFINEI